MVEHGVTGVLFDPLNAADMRSGVEKILCDNAFAKAAAVRAKQMALVRFHPRTVARKHLVIYREVLGEKTGCTGD